MIYLDHAATTPPADEVCAAMNEAHGQGWGNPSSVHAVGQRARRMIDEARGRVATAIGGRPGEVTFTSGGTESDNLAIRGLIERYSNERGQHVITTAIEHEAVLATCEHLRDRGQIELTILNCDYNGVVSAESVAAAVRPDTVLVSVMLVNNEIGAIQDLRAIVAAVRERNPQTLVHSDASQALGRVPIHVDSMDLDLLTLSAHKAYGPQGVGALWVRRGINLTSQATGGGQERARRSGTQNVAGIVGFGVAANRAETRRDKEMQRQGALAKNLRARVDGLSPQLWISSKEHAVANIVTVAVPGIESEVLVTAMDREGVCVSGGSACSSGATQPSHVLRALHIDGGPVRFSLGESTTAEDVDTAVTAFEKVLSRSQRSTSTDR